MLLAYQDQAILKSVNQTLAREEDGTSSIDGETFFRIIITARSIAVSRPSNLVRYTDNPDVTLVSEQADMGEWSPFIAFEINLCCFVCAV